ncbi:bifunctional sugar-1-phosphate nucleotidylyltransferase/acetyltransferase [Haloarcula nitratireducens]|uniref:Bifunctional protein GlmU n=1 Tax=Haloarcula nitratireducens TaxID=2487749 RepID=A0AAW4PCX7_9EURY|nr:bifunctional sugar-1-phosphate nucleotidylyltransferase/acetyltransferase [Halomicroarcula nitratireducens]MBX0295740.1 NTP transferase domain-containing protein [Halomicroarcula nitratireducens]
MQAVILAAGEGTRMRPLTDQRPKPMLGVGGTPLVEHVARSAVSAGAEEVIVVVGYEGEQVKRHLGDGVGDAPVHYAEQEDQQGTADAVAAAREHLDGPFAVLNGDNVYEPDALARLFESAPSIACTRVDEPSNYGVVETDGETVSGLLEKPAEPPSDLVNAGAYVFPATAREALDVTESERGERELTDVLNRVIDDSDVTPVVIDDWLDVGRPWELLAANERHVSRQSRTLGGDVHDDATVAGDVVVEPGASVAQGATVEGPVVVESGASVGRGATVRGPTLLGTDTEIGTEAEVENSVLMSGTSVGRESVVRDSVLGRNCQLGAETTVRNGSDDDGSVSVTVKGDRVSTRRQTFGAVLGDGVETGAETTLEPGVKLPTDATTEPEVRVSDDP